MWMFKQKSDCNFLYSDLIILGLSTRYGVSVEISFSKAGILVGTDIISNTAIIQTIRRTTVSLMDLLIVCSYLLWLSYVIVFMPPKFFT